MRERVVMNILRWPVVVWMRTVFRPQVVKNELTKDEGPVVFIGNHVSFEDPILAMLYSNRPISFLGARINYDNKFKKVVFDVMKIIPFTKGKMDIKALKQMKKCIDKGKSVGLYPEGGRTWDGSNIYIIESIANLIKLMKVPVYHVNLMGVYFVNPRWAKNYRKGKTKLAITKVLDKEQVKKLSGEEVLTAIKDAMTYDEYERQRTDKIEYRGKALAESIEKVIYKCPNCLAVDSFTSKGNEFWCTECSKKYLLDKLGFIHGSEKFDNLHSWNVWQQEFIDEIYNEKLPFVNNDVRLSVVEGKKTKNTKCDFIVDKEKVSFGEVEIDAKNISSPNIVFKNVVEFFDDKTKYRIKLVPTKHTSITLTEQMIKKMVAESKKNKDT